MRKRKGELSMKELVVVGMTIVAIALLISVIQGGVDNAVSQTLEQLL